MRSAVLRDGSMKVVEGDDPLPQEGQVLCRTLACGICGSDLHFVKHGRSMSDLGIMGDIDFPRDIFMGHEFAAEVIECGPGVDGLRTGTVVTSVPAVIAGGEVRQFVYSNDLPAGYCEYLLLSPALFCPVPNGLSAEHATLTEPLAVGVHAVARSGITRDESALVIGCGPVGLAIIAALRLAGVEVVIASDPAAIRRQVAATMGATETVNPNDEPAIEVWRRSKGAGPVVIFEAVGVPGMLDGILADCPAGGRVVVVGACMEPDPIVPARAMMKELSMQFVMGYSPDEFARSLRFLSEGLVDPAPLITGHVDIGGIPATFDALSQPSIHCKIIVVP